MKIQFLKHVILYNFSCKQMCFRRDFIQQPHFLYSLKTYFERLLHHKIHVVSLYLGTMVFKYSTAYNVPYVLQVPLQSLHVNVINYIGVEIERKFVGMKYEILLKNNDRKSCTQSEALAQACYRCLEILTIRRDINIK